jgi:hypothetical protein
MRREREGEFQLLPWEKTGERFMTGIWWWIETREG